MESILSFDKLEKLLLANWAQFLNSSKLLGYILNIVQENIDRFAVIPMNKVNPQGMSVTLSRCEWTQHGFIIWAEFSVTLSSDKVAEGTTELCLKQDGNLSHLSTIGNIYIQNI